LITLQALQLGLIDQPVLYASPALERKKDEYIDRMFDVSTKSEWENWIAFFLDAVTESCKESIVVIDKVISLQKEYRQRAPSIGRSVNLLQVIDCLFDSPVTTIPRVQKQLGVSPRAANLIVKKLVSAGILHELIQGHPSIYVAQEIRNVSSP
jgi:Fic family protein